MSIFEVVEDSEEESLEAPKGLLNRKHSAPVLDRTRATIRWGFGFARKLQRPPCLDLSVHLAHELSEAFGELWHQASVVTEPSDLSFWTQVEFPGYRDV
jgi:hypothetical protein